MELRTLTCIVCPRGCQLVVEMQGENVITVSGNSCPRGAQYASEECTHPTRVLTSTVQLSGGLRPVLPVKTTAPVPKEKLFDAMKEIREITAEAPVKIGQVLCKNLCGTGIAVVASADAEKAEKS